MRFLENLFIKIFSLIVFALSLVIILMGFNLVKVVFLKDLVEFLLYTELRTRVTLIVCFVLLLVSLKIFITSSGKPKNGKDGIILENSSGKLIISKESLDNLIYSASKDVPGAENITSKTYLDLEQNLRVFVTVTITQDVSIKELSTTLQSKIKSAIKQTADLDVSEVNVKIKNIVNKKTRKIKDNYTENKVEVSEAPSIIEEPVVNVIPEENSVDVEEESNNE